MHYQRVEVAVDFAALHWGNIMGKHRGDKRAQFVCKNLEILGFGNVRDGLTQTVKELFENALDAVGSASVREASLHNMLRIRIAWNSETGVVDIVCADTGTGMRAHEIRQLCCGVFETTKAGDTMDKSSLSCGKYGLGLKAAVLYSQAHVPGSSLKVVTTSNASDILYIELRIDAESEQPAVVQHVQSFAVDDGPHQFSGTEMRLSVPAPESQEDVEYVADILAVYFQSLRYTAPETIGVEFALEIGETRIELGWEPGQNPVDRFASDFGASIDDLVHSTRSSKMHNTNCMALFISNSVNGAVHDDIEVTVLRYANHAPLVNADDFFLCALTKGILSCRAWKKIGHSCRRNSSHLMSQLIASPTQHRRSPLPALRSRARLVFAIDLSTDVDSINSPMVKHMNLKKTALDKSYLKDAQQCAFSIIEQLHQRGAIVSPQQTRDEELLLEYAPLIANAAASILNRSRQITAACDDSAANPASSQDAALLAKSLQGILHEKLGSNKYRIDIQ